MMEDNVLQWVLIYAYHLHSPLFDYIHKCIYIHLYREFASRPSAIGTTVRRKNNEQGKKSNKCVEFTSCILAFIFGTVVNHDLSYFSELPTQK